MGQAGMRGTGGSNLQISRNGGFGFRWFAGRESSFWC